MKNKWVLRGILLASMVITGCGGPGGQSSQNSSFPSLPSIPSSSSSEEPISIDFGSSSSKSPSSESSSSSSKPSSSSSKNETTSSSKPSSSSSTKPSSNVPSSSSSIEQSKLTSITINSRKSQTSFQLGDEFVKPVVIAHYTRDDDKDVSNLCTYSGFLSNSKGEKTVTVTYTEDGIIVSTQYVVTITDRTFDFSNVMKMYTVLQNNELMYSNNSVIEEVMVSGLTTDNLREEFTNYTDYSSSSVGSYMRKSEDEIVSSDTFKAIKTKLTDKYKIEGQTISYDMFVAIKDFDLDVSSSYSYTDKVSKQFILNNAQEAVDGGLVPSQYILKADFAKEASANLTLKFFLFLENYAANNIYLETLGLTEVTEVLQDDGTIKYDFNETYGYDTDEGNRLDVVVRFNFTVNQSKERLLAYSYEYLETETNKLDATDTYTSGLRGSGEISYGNKSSDKTGALNANDYFLSEINEYQLLGRNTNFDDVVVDPERIPASYSYLFLRATRYSPSKAVDIQLSPEATSNNNVVTLENGMFRIVSEGDASLAFSYFKKVNGIYEKTLININVTIGEMSVESVSIGTYQTNFYQQYGLMVGQTYDWPIYVSPYKANPAVTIVSSDENVLRVNIVRDREIQLVPVGEGRATITVTSVNNPAKTASKEFYVLDPELDISNFLVKNTFRHASPYGYEMIMTFNDNGTGTRVQHIYDSGREYTDTFRYVVSGNIIRYSNFSYIDSNTYVRGTIVRYLDKTGLPFGVYCETEEKGQTYEVL